MRIYTPFILISLILIADSSVYQKYYDEALTIAKAMTIEEKVGQAIQVDFGAFQNDTGFYPEIAAEYYLGSLLVGGNGAPNQKGDLIRDYGDEQQNIEIYANASMDKWQKLAAKFNYTMNVTTKDKYYFIKAILATDAVHNNQHVAGTILFPHNSGLSCSHNPDHFYNLGKWTAKNVKQSGFHYAFAPTVAVSHNPHWGRFYQTMGSNSSMIYKYGKAYVEGLQGKPNALTGIIGSVKHFIGDGATMYGADEGNVHVSNFKTFLEHNIQGYIGAVQAQVGTVMCSYSAINWLPMAISPMLPKIIRQDLKFDGFVISDYDELGRIIYQHLPTSFQTMRGLNESVASSMNAGVDMMMIPPFQGATNIQLTADAMKEAVRSGTITEQRMNDAVARILSVKMAIGLVSSHANNQKGQKNMRTEQLKKEQTVQIVSETTEYQDSLNAVHESLVLLKNKNNILPMKTQNLEYIVFVGERVINIYGANHLYQDFNNIGLQCGGWSLRWQGFQGNGLWEGQNKVKTNATSILDALNNLKQKFQAIYPRYSTFRDADQVGREREAYLSNLTDLRKNMNANNTLLLAVVGEPPFAQFAGDVGIPYCEKDGELSGQGCMYGEYLNPYLNGPQRPSLDLKFDQFDTDVINKVREQDKNIPLVTVMFSGRTLLVGDILDQSDAFIDAFLPGTSGGQGVVDGITGNYVIRPNGNSDRNTLGFDWPKSQEQLKNFPAYKADGKIPRIPDPLFSQGYGLSTAK